jgi:hypothetical protein
MDLWMVMTIFAFPLPFVDITHGMYMVLSGLYLSADYILSGFGLMWMGRAAGRRKSLRAWVPVFAFRYYVMGKIMGSMNLFGRKIKEPADILPAVVGVAELLFIIPAGGVLFVMVFGALAIAPRMASDLLSKIDNVAVAVLAVFVLVVLKINYEFFRALGQSRPVALLCAPVSSVGFILVGQKLRAEARAAAGSAPQKSRDIWSALVCVVAVASLLVFNWRTLEAALTASEPTAATIDIVHNAVNDGVDFGTDGDGLLNPSNSIYYGAYDHAAKLEYQAEDLNAGPVSEREGSRRPILWEIMGSGDGGGIALLSRYVLDSVAFDESGGSNAYGDSDIKVFLEGMAAGAENFCGAERGGMMPVDIVTRMYAGETGKEMRGMRQGTKYPATVPQQLLYLPHGDDRKHNVYWSAGDFRIAFFALVGGTAVNETTLRNGQPALYRLRSPSPIHSDKTLAVYTGGFVLDGTRVHVAMGVRPVFRLDPALVVFASAVAAAPKAGQTPADDNYAVSEGRGKHFRLTVLNAGLPPAKLCADGNLLAEGDAISVQSGAGLTLTADGNTADGLAYKIVDGPDDARRIAGCGSGGPGELFVNALDADGSALAPGEYSLYIWAQKDNEIYSNEASEPQRFALRVTE